ncbi:MAG: TolB family protein, partial [Myxococcaceae bacterium]
WVLAIRAHETPESRRLLILPTGVGVERSVELTALRLIRRARFAPDGRHVAVIARADDAPGFAVHWVDRETGQHHPLTTADLGGPFLEISPDGSKVATVGRGGVLTVVPVSGGPPLSLSEPGEPWVPAGWDGNGALFARRLYDLPAHIFRIDLTTGARQTFATAAPLDTSGVNWIIRLKVAAASRTIGFSYPVTRSKVLLLSWGGPGL